MLEPGNGQYNHFGIYGYGIKHGVHWSSLSRAIKL